MKSKKTLTLLVLFVLSFSTRAGELKDIREMLDGRWEKIAAPPGIQKWMEKLTGETLELCKQEYEGVTGQDLLEITRFSAVPIDIGHADDRVFLVVAPPRCRGWQWGSALMFWFLRAGRNGKLELIFQGPYHGYVIHKARTNGYRDISGHYAGKLCRYRFDGKEYGAKEADGIQYCNR